MSSSDFDQLRAAFPRCGFAAYAYEPGGPVTLEIITSFGEPVAIQAATLADAIALATAAPPGAAPKPDPEPAADIFG